MSRRRLLALWAFLFLGGCLYHAREQADLTVCDLAARPFDLQPTQPQDTKGGAPKSAPEPVKKAEGVSGSTSQTPALDVQTTAFMQPNKDLQQPAQARPRIDLTIPPEIPGSEAPRIILPKDKTALQREIQRIYPELPPLPEEPVPRPGPDGQPYTLSALQQLAAANSPDLRQAAADVEAARGNLILARAYPNPTVGYQVTPSNDGSTAGLQGPFVDQTIKFAGKIKLASAAAQMDLQNAELALRRARSDLATRVRNAYYSVLVAKETARVSRALARFTDDIYRLQARLLETGLYAAHEPAALRAQAYTTRLAYKQAIQTYIYTWQQLVATLGLRHLPLTEVAGRIDAVIPYFDYDAVREYALRNHTDVLMARNGIDKARYNLKLAQITPHPDVDINVAFLKEYALPPKQFVHTVTLGMPFPIWNRNQGGVIAAESALARAAEEPHRVEESLTNTLASAYMGYKNNLDALEYYRKFILPDQVRYYRGVFDRRQIDSNAAFADLVTAQQTLAANVTSYLGILGSLWSSVISVTDLLQTDDLFQLGQPLPVPTLPDLDSLPSWPCCHDCPPAGAGPKGECCPQGANAPRSPIPGFGIGQAASPEKDEPSPKDQKPVYLPSVTAEQRTLDRDKPAGSKPLPPLTGSSPKNGPMTNDQ
jgi:cobalt-zinc-cadmium efflux system outer membrane protein